MGIGAKVGSLEVGKFADFVMISPARLGAVLEDPYANLVLAAEERDVDAVYVGGELVVDHGRVMRGDLPKTEAEVSRRVLVKR